MTFYYENVHRFAPRGDLLKRERERERKREEEKERERKKGKQRERNRKKEKERKRKGKKERERERTITITLFKNCIPFILKIVCYICKLLKLKISKYLGIFHFK